MFWKTNGAWILPHPHFSPEDAGAGWQAMPLVEISTAQQTGGGVTVAADEMDFGYVDEFVKALDNSSDTAAPHEHPCRGEVSH